MAATQKRRKRGQDGRATGHYQHDHQDGHDGRNDDGQNIAKGSRQLTQRHSGQGA